MTHPEFQDFQETLLDKVVSICQTKGIEYVNSEADRLANFKRLSAALGISPLVVAWIYLTKHLDAIASFVRTGKVYSEPLEGRIIDAIAYLTLIAALTAEATEERERP